MMKTFERLHAKQSAQEYRDIERYCEQADMRLSRDPVNGYWLHYDGRMRFVRHLSDVRGMVNYLNR